MSKSAPAPSIADDSWESCPTGELQGMVSRLNAQQRSRQRAATLKTSATVAMGVALLVVSVGLLQGPALEPMGCQECVANFDALHLNLTEGVAMLGSDLDRMKDHLASCEPCNNKYERMFPGELSQLLALANPTAWPALAALTAAAWL